ncbi:hypothetical protein OQA88_2000 [Cercophora sp. LCS_1]
MAPGLSTTTTPAAGRGGAITSSVAAGRGGVSPQSPRTGNAPPTLNLNLPIQLPRGESTRATDRTDALWAEMQATLEEVELSASGGTRVFGPDHERKLSELRTAQIALAQAWARSEADDAIETVGGHNKSGSTAAEGAEGGGKSEAVTGTDGAKSTAGTGSGRPGSSGMGAGGEKLGARLNQETEADILLARKRREANDHYFQRVNQGVLDVVARLEEVATAMRAVEQESKDVWGDGDGDSAPTSVPGSAKT